MRQAGGSSVGMVLLHGALLVGVHGYGGTNDDAAQVVRQPIVGSLGKHAQCWIHSQALVRSRLRTQVQRRTRHM